MKRYVLAALGSFSLAGALLLPPSPAQAVSFGEPDGTSHPAVGALLATLDVGSARPETFVVCSGSLLSPTSFLTAGHCFNIISAFGAQDIWVTFASDLPVSAYQDPRFPPVIVDKDALPASSLVPVDSWAYHPEASYTALRNDVAVARLHHPVTGITPVSLPSEGFLDEQRAAGALTGREVTLVGYGVDMQWAPGSPHVATFDGVRKTSALPVLGLTPWYLVASGDNAMTGAGGPCNSDSGGPLFWSPAGQPGGSTVVSLVIWGDGPCRALSQSQRLDTPTVLAFLRNYV